MSSSTFTPNLGIEQPATGMYANTWGNVANRSYAVIDAAIGGNAQIVIQTPHHLTTAPGTDPSDGLYPFIIWTGPLSAQGTVSIEPASEQRLYIMSNRTSGGFPIAFSQGAGSQFVLQPGYDAQIYCDGGGANANVAAAIANPQFSNVLVTGSLMVEGNLSSSSGSLAFQDVAVTTLGIGNPSSMPDPLVINGAGPTASIRLVMQSGSDHGVVLANDGDYFYLLTTAANDPYGGVLAPPYVPLSVDLTHNVVGIAGGSADPSYALTTLSIHCTSLVADAAITCLQLAATGAIKADAGASNTGSGSQIDLVFGGNTEGVSSPRTVGSTNQNGLTFFTAAQPRVYITNAGSVGILRLPDAGHALCVSGYIHTTSGIVFPDGSIQTTAVSGTFTQLTVNGNGTISGSLSVGGPATVNAQLQVNGNYYGPGVNGSPRLFLQQAYPSSGFGPKMTPNTMCFANSPYGIYIWWCMNDGSLWFNNQIMTPNWQQYTGPVQ